MRLRDIQIIIDENAKDLNLNIERFPGQSSLVMLNKVQELIASLKAIESTGILREQLDRIKGYQALFLATDDSISFQKDQADKLKPIIDKLRNDCRTVSIVVSEIMGDQGKLSMSVRLPEIEQLKDLIDITESLDKIFDQLLVNKNIDGKVSLQAFDTGSEWLELVFNSAKAFSVFASVIYSVILLQREQIKNNEFREVARNRKITNDLMENLGALIDDNVSSIMEGQIKEIMKEAGAKDNDQEYFERIKFCINESTKLITRGMQFFPSSKSATEISSTFPDFSKNSLDEMLPTIKELPENIEGKQ